MKKLLIISAFALVPMIAMSGGPDKAQSKKSKSKTSCCHKTAKCCKGGNKACCKDKD